MARPTRPLNLEPVQTWGIYDFRDRDAYPRTYKDIVQTDPALSVAHNTMYIEAAWKWEFLRRTKAYRQYWELHSFRNHDEEFEDFWHPSLRIRGELPNPASTFSEIPPHGLFEASLPIPTLRSYTIDHSRSIPPQLEAIKSEIESLQNTISTLNLESHQILSPFAQPRQTKTSKIRYVPFLRALDAREVGASYSVIDQVINKQDVGRSNQGLVTYKQALNFQKTIAMLESLEEINSEPELLPLSYR